MLCTVHSIWQIYPCSTSLSKDRYRVCLIKFFSTGYINSILAVFVWNSFNVKLHFAIKNDLSQVFCFPCHIKYVTIQEFTSKHFTILKISCKVALIADDWCYMNNWKTQCIHFSDWATDYGRPWWLDEKYCIGKLSQKTRFVRIINTLTLQEDKIEVIFRLLIY